MISKEEESFTRLLEVRKKAVEDWKSLMQMTVVPGKNMMRYSCCASSGGIFWQRLFDLQARVSRRSYSSTAGLSGLPYAVY